MKSLFVTSERRIAATETTETFDTASQAQLFLLLEAEQIIDEASVSSTQEESEGKPLVSLESVLNDEAELELTKKRIVRRMLAKEAQILDMLNTLVELESMLSDAGEPSARQRWEINRRKESLFAAVRTYTEHEYELISRG